MVEAAAEFQMDAWASTGSSLQLFLCFSSSAVPVKTQVAVLSTCVLVAAQAPQLLQTKEAPTSCASSHRSLFSSINMLESD